MPSPAITDVYTYADDLLSACKAALALTSEGCPTTTFVSPGPPAVDCCPGGILTTYAAGITLDNTMTSGAPIAEYGHRTAHGRIMLVGLTAMVTRCIVVSDDGSLTDPATLSAEALIADEDVWAIWNYVSAALRAGTLFQGPCKSYYFDNALPLLPQGGCAGWVFPLRVEIPGLAITP